MTLMPDLSTRAANLCLLLVLLFISPIGLALGDDGVEVGKVPPEVKTSPIAATTLRPGDTVYLSLPGEESLNSEVQIKRNGTLLVPEVGEVRVQGLTVAEATAKIKLQLQDVIHDVSTFELEIKQRRLIISVLGYVKSPGAVDLDPGATVQEALSAADGLLEGAQLNKLQVRRNGEVIRFDYKRYLDSGNASILPVLQPLDTIFVPASSLMGNVQVKFDPKTHTTADSGDADSPAIMVLGEVLRPGAYDWADNLTLFDLINRAGGPNQKANLAKLKILSKSDEGVISNQIYDLASFIENGGALAEIPQLTAGDTVIVPSVDAGDNKSKWLKQATDDSIYVMGEVNEPGRYLFSNKMHFLDILAAAKGPNDKADIHNIRVTHRKDGMSYVTQLNLGRYFETGNETLLPAVMTGDVIYVPSKNRQWTNEPSESTVRVLGAVTTQGRYRYDKSMTILDLLAQAGGLSASAESSHIVVVNADCCEKKKVHRFDLIAFSESGDFNDLPHLDAGDTVYVLHKADSTWNRVMENIQETISVISILKILSGT